MKEVARRFPELGLVHFQDDVFFSTSNEEIEKFSVLWQKEVEGDARGITVVDKAFIVTTTAGKIYCYGAGKRDSKKQITHKAVKPSVGSKVAQQAKNIIKASGVKAGYAIMLLPHAFILGHQYDAIFISTVFMMIYAVTVLFCLWKIVRGKI